DYAGKLKVAKLNVDEAMNSAGRYNIREFPPCSYSRTGRSSSRLSVPCRRIRLQRRWTGTSGNPVVVSSLAHDPRIMRHFVFAPRTNGGCPNAVEQLGERRKTLHVGRQGNQRSLS